MQNSFTTFIFIRLYSTLSRFWKHLNKKLLYYMFLQLIDENKRLIKKVVIKKVIRILECLLFKSYNPWFAYLVASFIFLYRHQTFIDKFNFNVPEISTRNFQVFRTNNSKKEIGISSVMNRLWWFRSPSPSKMPQVY